MRITEPPGERAGPRRLEEVGTPCIDGTTLSASDVRSNAEKAAAERDAMRRTIYTVAACVNDADECRTTFDMFGIDIATVRATRQIALLDQSD